LRKRTAAKWPTSSRSLTKRTTRDELGLGGIRDSFADLLFPAPSTIQTRARYFLFVPWIYQELERRRTPPADIEGLARRAEIRLIHALENGGETEGVIGSLAQDRLMRLPSSIYWAGLGKLGIRRFAGSLEQYHRGFAAFCHALVHWNLPTNPVDLEQREGRVHRFKGHFIRKNLARAYRIEGTKGARDPWAAIFRTALDERPDTQNDMVPFRIFDGPFKIERRLPMLPLSRETTRLDDLKQSLALYRLTFGQPRQEELLEFLKRHSAEGPESAAAVEQHIDLRPPAAQ
jgi:hypothetical protein